jgi:hypothetical protein
MAEILQFTVENLVDREGYNGCRAGYCDLHYRGKKIADFEMDLLGEDGDYTRFVPTLTDEGVAEIKAKMSEAMKYMVKHYPELTELNDQNEKVMLSEPETNLPLLLFFLEDYDRELAKQKHKHKNTVFCFTDKLPNRFFFNTLIKLPYDIDDEKNTPRIREDVLKVLQKNHSLKLTDEVAKSLKVVKDFIFGESFNNQKLFAIPVSWTTRGHVTVKANDADEALQIAEKQNLKPIPAQRKLYKILK